MASSDKELVLKLRGEIARLTQENKSLIKEKDVYKNNALKLSESDRESSNKINHQQRELERLRQEQKKHADILQQKNNEIASLNELFIKKKGTKKFDLTEGKKKLEEDKAATEQQLRAYKRQVDDLRHQLDHQKEQCEQMKSNLEKQLHESLAKLEWEKKTNSELMQQYKKQLDDANRELSKCQNENLRIANVCKTLQQQQHHQIPLSTMEQMMASRQRQRPQTMEQMEAGRSVQVMPHVRPPYASFPLDQRTPDQFVQHREEERIREQYLNDQTKRADDALKEYYEFQEQQTRERTAPLATSQHSTAQLLGQPLNTCNDKDSTEEGEIPYDPNLVCQRCGAKYRFGEIQKLRRHVNEYCKGL